MPLSQLIIMENPRSLFTAIQQQEGDGSSTETFTASRGWFEKFIHRSNIHSIRITGEAASSNMQAAQEFPDMLKQIIHQGNYPPQLVFNVGETALFWKRMPSRTFISREEKHASGFKCAKDRLTLLLGSNASGDFKLKPMLVYHSENPRALKGLSKDHLPVIWRANKKAWVTEDLFQQWYTSSFCPAVVLLRCKKNSKQKRCCYLTMLQATHSTSTASRLPCLLKSCSCLPPQLLFFSQWTRG